MPLRDRQRAMELWSWAPPDAHVEVIETRRMGGTLEIALRVRERAKPQPIADKEKPPCH